MGRCFLNEWRERLNVAIDCRLRQQADRPLLDVMLCAAEGGDRVLGLLTLSCCDAAGGDAYGALNLGAAVEMIYAANRVVEEARTGNGEKGKPPIGVHAKFGLWSAHICTYALVAAAFEAAIQGDVPDFMCAEIVLELAQATGAKGLALQQCKALVHDGTCVCPISGRAGEGIPVLFSAGAKVGAIGAYAAPHTVKALAETGEHIGRAYQTVEDWVNDPHPGVHSEDLRRRLSDHLGQAWTQFGKAFGRHSGSDLLLEWQEMVQASLADRISQA